MDLAGDDGTLDAIANQADRENGTATVTVFTQSEPFTCAYPAQSVEDFIDLSIYADSPTKEAELEPEEQETVNVTPKTNQALNRNFEGASSVMFLLTPIALVVAGMIMAGLWVITSFSTVLIALVKYLMPRLDKVLTEVLLGTVAVVNYLFGADTPEDMNPKLLEIRHLI